LSFTGELPGSNLSQGPTGLLVGIHHQKDEQEPTF